MADTSVNQAQESFLMAVVSLSTSILASADSLYRDGTAGVTIAAGEVVYLNTATSRYALADADASAGTSVAVGIAMNGAAAGQPLKILVDGTITNATGLKAGQTYVLANVAGDIAEALSDLSEDTSYVCFIGIGLSTTSLRVKPLAGNVILNAA